MFMNTMHTLGALAPNRNEMKRIECERSCFAKMCPYPLPSKKTLAKMEIDYSFHLQSSSRYFPPECGGTHRRTHIELLAMKKLG